MGTAQGKDIADIHTRPYHPLVVGIVAELVAVAEILISREWAGPGLVYFSLATYSRLEMTKWRWVQSVPIVSDGVRDRYEKREWSS